MLLLMNLLSIGQLWRIKEELVGFFVLTLFLLSVIFTEIEIKVLEKGLDFVTVQRTLNFVKTAKNLVVKWDISHIFVMAFLKRLGK